jgi:hypothetical protein
VLVRAAPRTALGLRGHGTPANLAPCAASAQGVVPTSPPSAARSSRITADDCGRLLDVAGGATPLGQLGRVNRLEQRQRVEVDLAGDALQALERQVALAALDATHIGAVDAEFVGECLLAEALTFPVGTQVAPDRSLEIAFHKWEDCRLTT